MKRLDAWPAAAVLPVVFLLWPIGARGQAPSAVYPPPRAGAAHAASGLTGGDCAACHPTATERIRPSAGVALRFSHRSHRGAARTCADCHPRGAWPGFGSCRPCHQRDLRPDRCATCHPADADGRLKLQAASGKLSPRGGHGGGDHGPGWERGHARVAAAEQRACATCHASSSCDRCHRGVRRPWRQHPADWGLLHATVARGGSADCQVCHRSQSDCLNCHRQAGVSPSPEDGPVRFRLHPQGFAEGARHGPEARRNMSACSACHREADCIRCHGAAGIGLGVSPHPPGFRNRCRLWYSRNPRPCLKCHEADDLLECRP